MMANYIYTRMPTYKHVVIVQSPYACVRNGTIAVLEKIVPNHFGPGQHLYVLAGVPCTHFREHEISPLDEITEKA